MDNKSSISNKMNKEAYNANSEKKALLKQLSEFKSKAAFLNVYGNYSKFINNMFSTCGSICIKDFHNEILNAEEETCVNKCQQKYLRGYIMGENYLKAVSAKSKEADIFSDMTHLELIDISSQKN